MDLKIGAFQKKTSRKWKPRSLLLWGTSRTIWNHHIYYLEDHPRYRKWLGSPHFFPAIKRLFGRGPTTPLRGQQRSPWLLTAYVRHGMILHATQPPFFRHPIQWVTETTTTTGSLKSNVFFCLETCAPRVFGVHPIRNLGFKCFSRFGWCIFHKRCNNPPIAALKNPPWNSHIFRLWQWKQLVYGEAFLFGGRKMLFVSG